MIKRYIFDVEIVNQRTNENAYQVTRFLYSHVTLVPLVRALTFFLPLFFSGAVFLSFSGPEGLAHAYEHCKFRIYFCLSSFIESIVDYSRV